MMYNSNLQNGCEKRPESIVIYCILLFDLKTTDYIIRYSLVSPGGLSPRTNIVIKVIY